jgi:hypothetical protein
MVRSRVLGDRSRRLRRKLDIHGEVTRWNALDFDVESCFGTTFSHYHPSTNILRILLTVFIWWNLKQSIRVKAKRRLSQNISFNLQEEISRSSSSHVTTKLCEPHEFFSVVTDPLVVSEL